MRGLRRKPGVAAIRGPVLRYAFQPWKWNLTSCSRSAENEIVGEALVALQHDDLKQMGVTRVGHRLTILKSVYDIKTKQDIPLESDHYVPLCRSLVLKCRDYY